MDNHDHVTPIQTSFTGERVKMVQISIMFRSDTDAEALEVKSLISEALKERKGMAISFTMQER